MSLRFSEEPLHPARSKCQAVLPQIYKNVGMMKMPLSVRIRSASSVVRPLAPSAEFGNLICPLAPVALKGRQDS